MLYGQFLDAWTIVGRKIIYAIIGVPFETEKL